MNAATLAQLLCVGLIAGFIDAIAGGGGLLALPSLMLAGLDPISALATNKLQGTFGTASATYTFWKRGLLTPKNHTLEIALVFASAALGVLAVAYVPIRFLHYAMPIMLVSVALYFAFTPQLSKSGSKPKLGIAVFSFCIAPLIGFYDGIFGPGTGSFFIATLVGLFGFGILQATGRTKMLNFASNCAALLMFVFTGKIVWVIGLSMGLAQIVGAQLGARMAIANGAKIIRPLLVLVCCAMAAKLWWQFT
jgi:uncharacterized membrane protein YfcA